MALGEVAVRRPRLIIAAAFLSGMVAAPIRAAEPGGSAPKSEAVSLGPGLMVQIATRPLLLMVATEPTHLRFRGKGARLADAPGVYRSVVTASAPKGLRGLVGERVNLYESSGKSCGGVVRELVFVNRQAEIYDQVPSKPLPPPLPIQVLSPGDFVANEPDPSPPPPLAESKKEQPISAAMWNPPKKDTFFFSAGDHALTVRIEPEPGCAPDKLVWGRQASLPSVEVYAAAPLDAALAKSVTQEAVRLFESTSHRAKESADPLQFKSWNSFVRKNLRVAMFQGPRSGRRIISASIGFRQEAACSNVGNFALFESQGSPASLLRLRPVEALPSYVRAAVDLDGDGFPELVVWDGALASYIDGTTLLFSNGGRYNGGENLTVAWDCEE